ncbi:MAG: hypothetical protein QOE11_425 [Solirubrobacteraceae bacterium]|jgi:hypothetical protein|nr:hypothetical protein [Solirubrobacteraceae bacterium]
MAPATLEHARTGICERELAYRRSGALDVFLLWHPAEDAVSVRVEDLRTGVRIEMDVDQSTALRAFQHPFSYAP